MTQRALLATNSACLAHRKVGQVAVTSVCARARIAQLRSKPGNAAPLQPPSVDGILKIRVYREVPPKHPDFHLALADARRGAVLDSKQRRN